MRRVATVLNQKPKASTKLKDAADTKPIPLFDTLGYGFDIVTGKTGRRIFNPTYRQGGKFTFRDMKYAVPDGMMVDPSPKMESFRTSEISVERDIHDHQSALAASMGVKTETYGEFALSGSVQSRRKWFTEGCHYLISAGGSYSFFKMSIDPTEDGILDPTVLEKLKECKNAEAFEDFFERYGTHMVVSGNVGGLMSMEIETDVTKMDQSQANATFLQTQGSTEIEGVTIEASASFSKRSEKTSASYRSSSSRSLTLIGGRITANSYKEWRESLESAELPVMTGRKRSIHAERPGLATMKVGDAADVTHNPLLALSNLKLVSMARLLPSTEGLRERVQKQIDAYAKRNRIEAKRNQIVPLVGGSGKIHSIAPGKSNAQNAWALKKTYVKFGLQAYPGVAAEVHVIHPLAGDNSYKLWSGQTNEASWFYGAGEIRVTFTCNDPSARLHVRMW